MGLPPEDIRELGLERIPNGQRQFMTATGNVVLDTYTALGMIQDQGFAAWVMPSPIPIIGYEFLESLRFRVNPVSQELEKVPDGEIYPPYLLTTLDQNITVGFENWRSRKDY